MVEVPKEVVMEVNETSAVSQVAAGRKIDVQPGAVKTRQRQGDEPETGAPENNGEKVSISSNKQDVVVRVGSGRGREVRAENQGVNPSSTQNAPEFNRDISRDYSVDDTGQMVVKIIDKQKDEVVREIPPEEQRRIKEAIAELNKSSVATEIKPSEQAAASGGPAEPALPDTHKVDITT